MTSLCLYLHALTSCHQPLPTTCRGQSAWENQLAASRRNPNGGAYGPNTYLQGFVWREACGPTDLVCVPPASRSQAAADNAAAASRLDTASPGENDSPPCAWNALLQQQGCLLHANWHGWMTHCNPSALREVNASKRAACLPYAASQSPVICAATIWPSRWMTHETFSTKPAGKV